MNIALSADEPSNLAAKIGEVRPHLGIEEIPFKLRGTGKLNPYRQSELAADAVVTLPSGKIKRVPAFYDGTNGWKVRFYARESGKCSSTIEVRVKGKAKSFDGPDFQISHADEEGMVRISKRSAHYMERENGRSFFLVGQNVCFTSDVAYDIPCNKMSSEKLPWDVAYRKWFGQMGKNGANWARIWMRPNFTLEAGETWDWSLENARKVDTLMKLAKSNGLCLDLCFNAERSDTGRAMGGCFPPFAAKFTAWSPLLAKQGLNFSDFAVNELSQEMYRDKIRYIIARWGAYPNLGAWELWNELDCVEFRGSIEWSKSMTAYIRKTDPWGHIIKASGSTPYSAPIWGKEHGDINDVHPYFGWGGEEDPKNLGTFLTQFTSEAREEPMPYFVGETGIAREVTTKYGLAGDLADMDTTGFHVYEGLYGGLFSGAAGGGLLWWWDEHIDKNNVYGRFKALAQFVKGIDFAGESFVVSDAVSVSGDVLGAQCLKGRNMLLAWIRIKERNWFTVAVEKRSFASVSSVTVSFKGLAPGTYRIELWSPEEGKRVRVLKRTRKADGELAIELPEVQKDLALKVIRL